MHVEISTPMQVAKGMNVKREKGPGDVDMILVHLKFDKAPINRSQLEALLCRDYGWSNSFYDDMGAPHWPYTLTLDGFQASVTGKIKGVGETQEIKITQALLTGATVRLWDKGACLSGELIWRAAGDEISDLEPLFGNLCLMNVVMQDARQDDMFKTPVREEPQDDRGTFTDPVSGEYVDHLYPVVLAAIQSGQTRPTISTVQRTFKIGYNRAARYLEKMAEDGVLTWSNSDGGYTLHGSPTLKIPVAAFTESIKAMGADCELKDGEGNVVLSIKASESTEATH